MRKPVSVSIFVDDICNPIHEKQKSCIWLKGAIVKFNSNHKIERNNCLSEGDFIRIEGAILKDSKLFSDVTHRIVSAEGDTKRILVDNIKSGGQSFIQLTN